MNDTVTNVGARLQDRDDDYEGLKAARVGLNQYRVLSVDDDGVRAYEVDLHDLSCDCEHGQQGPSDGSVCRHISKAMLVHPSAEFLEDMTFEALSSLYRDAQSAYEAAQDARETWQTKQTAEARAAAEEAAEPSQDPGLSNVEKVELWLEDNGIPSGKVEVFEHEEFGSINFDTAGSLSDDEFSDYLDLCQQTDGVSFDSDAGVNFIKAADVDEVTG